MAIQKVDITRFLELSKSHPVFDVRSPGEYTHAHIPKAYNLPLFDDDQRKAVGTSYKQKSRQDAIKIGVEFFGSNMRKMIEKVEKVIKAVDHYNQTILIHCWRGGMRSAAVAWLMDVYGFEVYLLEGGYKAYRNYVLASFQKEYQFRMLGGFTGSGKTDLLQELIMLHQPVIDLEGIASHKGSAFGGIGMEAQPSQEMFENLLSTELIRISSETSDPIWLEDESQRIGALNIPHPIWHQMRKSALWFLDIPFTPRLEHLCKGYGIHDTEKLIEATERIRKRLGPVETTTTLSLLKEEKIKEAFAVLLRYYDKHYHKSLHNREELKDLLYRIDLPTNDVQHNIKILLSHLK